MIQAEVLLVVEEKHLLERDENSSAYPETTCLCHDCKIDITLPARNTLRELPREHDRLHEREETDETGDDCGNSETPPSEALLAPPIFNAGVGRGREKEESPS